MSVNMRPGTATMFPSPLQAAGEAGVSAGLAYDRQGEAQMREMSRMGLNPDSPRYAGLRQEMGLRKTAGVAGAKTRAAQSARAASFERLLDMISRGRSGGAFAPREQAIYAGRGGSSNVGPSAFVSGVRGVGEADPRIHALNPISAADFRRSQTGVTRVAFTPPEAAPAPAANVQPARLAQPPAPRAFSAPMERDMAVDGQGNPITGVFQGGWPTTPRQNGIYLNGELQTMDGTHSGIAYGTRPALPTRTRVSEYDDLN